MYKIIKTKIRKYTNNNAYLNENSSTLADKLKYIT
jgi:hypothetical protein